MVNDGHVSLFNLNLHLYSNAYDNIRIADVRCQSILRFIQVQSTSVLFFDNSFYDKLATKEDSSWRQNNIKPV